MHFSFPIEIGLGDFEVQLIESRRFHYKPKEGESGYAKTIAPYHFYSIILKGANSVKLEGESYEIEANDALLFKQGESFTAKFDSRCELEVVNVFFALESAGNKEVLDWLPRRIEGRSGIERFRESAIASALALSKGQSVMAKLNFALLLLEAASLKIMTDSKRYSRTCSNALEYIESNHRDLCTREAIAEACNVTPNYLSNLIKRETGKTIAEQVDHTTIEKAKNLLQTTSMNFSQIADVLGLDPYRFSKLFKRVTGMTPTVYSKTSFAQNVVSDK